MAEKNPENPEDKPIRGRPPKLTDELAMSICEAILDGMFRYTAAKRFRVSANTVRRWMKAGNEFPDGIYGTFRSLVLECEAEAERKAVKAILKAGHDEDPKHLEWWLERKFPQRWSRYRGELRELKRELEELRKAIGEITHSQTEV